MYRNVPRLFKDNSRFFIFAFENLLLDSDRRERVQTWFPYQPGAPATGRRNPSLALRAGGLGNGVLTRKVGRAGGLRFFQQLLGPGVGGV
jgi:hypothetical protein